MVFIVAFSLFIPVYLFKVDEIDVNLVSLSRPDDIENPRKILIKLDTLQIMLREESLGDDKYSILLEGVIRDYQEYIEGPEIDLLNNFDRKEVKDKESFFKKRRSAIMRLISLYYIKGISRHTNFHELRLSFVYFMFDFLNLQNQSLQFLIEMQGHDMKPVDFFKWIIVKTEIENEIIRREEA